MPEQPAIGSKQNIPDLLRRTPQEIPQKGIFLYRTDHYNPDQEEHDDV